MSKYKTCNKCGQIKPISEYYQRKKNPIKYMAICKSCKRIYDKEYIKTYIPGPETKAVSKNWDKSARICIFCQCNYQPVTKWQKACSYDCGYFYQNSKKQKHINTRLCARCGKSLVDKNNKAIYCSKTCKSMDHTFKHRGGSRIGIARRMDIIKRDNATCYLCQRVIPIKKIELDHLIPYSRGGTSSPENLSVCCLSCNRSRGNRIDTEQLHRLRELRESNDH